VPSRGIDLESVVLSVEGMGLVGRLEGEVRYDGVLLFGWPMRFEAEDDGRCRALLVGPAFCCAREDCGLDVGPGLAATRGALKVPTKGDGARTGDPAFDALALE
jgi:hypothetical protein